jgi:predicted amidohydrolase
LSGRKFGICIAQLAPKPLDKEANLSRALEVLEWAHGRECSLVVFPELYLTGYCVAEHLERLAEDSQGPSVERICRWSQEYGVGVAMGFPERGPVSEVYYDSAFITSPSGEVVATYRKTHLFDTEKDIFTPGESFVVAQLPFCRAGIQICYDAEFPEVSRILTINGADVLLTLSANMEPFEKHQDAYLSARALENHVYHVLANRWGEEGGIRFIGRSGVCDPLGNVLCKAGVSEELLHATVDMDLSQRAKEKLEYMKNRRPSLYSDLVKVSRE